MTTFDAELISGTSLVTTYAELLVPGSASITLPVTDGRVDADYTAAVRRRCSSVAVVGRSLVPTTASGLLQPLQNEVRLWRGLVVDGVTVNYPLGTFGISESEITDDPSGPITTLSGMDRSQAVRENRWTRPYPVTSGTDIAAAITGIINNRFAGATFNFPASTGVTTPNLLFGSTSSNDPWKDCTELATAASCELFVDPYGTFVLRPVSNPDTDPPVWAFSDGAAGNLVALNKRLTREKTYTAVVAVSEGTGVTVPLRSDVSVPAARPRTYFWKTGAINNQAQLDAAANALLNRVSGAYSSVSFQAIPDPRLEVGTVGTVTRSAAGVAGKQVLESFQIALNVSAGPMSATVRGRNS